MSVIVYLLSPRIPNIQVLCNFNGNALPNLVIGPNGISKIMPGH